MTDRRIKVQRGKAAGGEPELVAHVKAEVARQLRELGLDRYRGFKDEVSDALNTISVILADLRASFAIAKHDVNSYKRRFEDLLEQLEMAFTNLDRLGDYKADREPAMSWLDQLQGDIESVPDHILDAAIVGVLDTGDESPFDLSAGTVVAGEPEQDIIEDIIDDLSDPSQDEPRRRRRGRNRPN